MSLLFINSSNMGIKVYMLYCPPADAVGALQNCPTTQGARTQGTLETIQVVLLAAWSRLTGYGSGGGCSGCGATP